MKREPSDLESMPASHLKVILDAPDSLETSECFLRHLLLEETIDGASQDDRVLVFFQDNMSP